MSETGRHAIERHGWGDWLALRDAACAYIAVAAPSAEPDMVSQGIAEVFDKLGDTDLDEGASPALLHTVVQCVQDWLAETSLAAADAPSVSDNLLWDLLAQEPRQIDPVVTHAVIHAGLRSCRAPHARFQALFVTARILSLCEPRALGLTDDAYEAYEQGLLSPRTLSDAARALLASRVLPNNRQAPAGESSIVDDRVAALVGECATLRDECAVLRGENTRLKSQLANELRLRRTARREAPETGVSPYLRAAFALPEIDMPALKPTPRAAKPPRDLVAARSRELELSANLAEARHNNAALRKQLDHALKQIDDLSGRARPVPVPSTPLQDTWAFLSLSSMGAIEERILELRTGSGDEWIGDLDAYNEVSALRAEVEALHAVIEEYEDQQADWAAEMRDVRVPRQAQGVAQGEAPPSVDDPRGPEVASASVLDSLAECIDPEPPVGHQHETASSAAHPVNQPLAAPELGAAGLSRADLSEWFDAACILWWYGSVLAADNDPATARRLAVAGARQIFSGTSAPLSLVQFGLAKMQKVRLERQVFAVGALAHRQRDWVFPDVDRWHCVAGRHLRKQFKTLLSRMPQRQRQVLLHWWLLGDSETLGAQELREARAAFATEVSRRECGETFRPWLLAEGSELVSMLPGSPPHKLGRQGESWKVALPTGEALSAVATSAIDGMEHRPPCEFIAGLFYMAFERAGHRDAGPRSRLAALRFTKGDHASAAALTVPVGTLNDLDAGTLDAATASLIVEALNECVQPFKQWAADVPYKMTMPASYSSLTVHGERSLDDLPRFESGEPRSVSVHAYSGGAPRS